MALRYGFFNSINGDRKYDALDMSSIFDGIIEDGVFATIGNMFAVTPGTGLQVLVDTGKAWFNHTWTTNDAQIPLTIASPDITLDRYDAIVLEVNNDESVRANSIKVVKGKAASDPQKPSAETGESLNQHILAYVLVKHGASSISSSDIEITVGKSECPFVTGPLETVPIDDLFLRWEAEFDAWFENVQSQLEGDVVTNLQKQIDDRVKISDKATDDDIADMVSNDKWMTPYMTAKAVESSAYQIGDIRSSARDLETETDGKYLTCDGRSIDESTYPELAKALSGRFGYNMGRRSGNILNGSGGTTLTGGIYAYSSAMSPDKSYAIVATENYVYRYRVQNGAIMINESPLSKASISGNTTPDYVFFIGSYGFVFTTDIYNGTPRIYRLDNNGTQLTEVGAIYDNTGNCRALGLYIDDSAAYILIRHYEDSYDVQRYSVIKVLESGTVTFISMKNSQHMNNHYQAIIYKGYVYFGRSVGTTSAVLNVKIPVNGGSETPFSNQAIIDFISDAYNGTESDLRAPIGHSEDFSKISCAASASRCSVLMNENELIRYSITWEAVDISKVNLGNCRTLVTNDGTPFFMSVQEDSDRNVWACLGIGNSKIIRMNYLHNLGTGSGDNDYFYACYSNLSPNNFVYTYCRYITSREYNGYIYCVYVDFQKPNIPSTRFPGQTGPTTQYIKALP